MRPEPDETATPRRRRPQSILRERTPMLSKLDEIRAASGWTDIFEGLPQYIGITILMVAGAFAMLSSPPDAPKLLGLSAAGWGQISIALAVLHQVVVAIVFRLQLHRNVLSATFGESDMHIWTWIFLPLLALRPISLIMTGWADVHGILGLRPAEWVIGLALLGASGWVLWTVFTKFTLPRALGGDHFRNEFAGMPLVTSGPFGVTPNAMYAIAFLGLWGIAFLFGSWNALVVALFQHAYIWVHMYCVEKPDMDWIYGDRLEPREPEAAAERVSGAKVEAAQASAAPFTDESLAKLRADSLAAADAPPKKRNLRRAPAPANDEGAEKASAEASEKTSGEGAEEDPGRPN